MHATDRSTSSGFVCGLMSGLTQSGVFNAYDRAMYHSIVHRRPFLDSTNWRGNPFAGVSPSFLQRSFSAGLYFPLEDLFKRHVSSNYAVDGLMVGFVGGVLTTPFNTVKYSMWSQGVGPSALPAPALISTAKSLLREGGFSRLMRGVGPTLYRDMTFGVTFSVLRHQADNGFYNNALAAFVATVLSSPFNYARMQVYGVKSGTPKSTRFILNAWRNEVMSSSFGWKQRMCYAVRSLNVVWGALRVGMGMGLGSQIYNWCNAKSLN